MVSKPLKIPSIPQIDQRVEVLVTVAPDGHVSNVEVTYTPYVSIGDLVKDDIKKVMFDKTKNGGSFKLTCTNENYHGTCTASAGK